MKQTIATLENNLLRTLTPEILVVGLKGGVVIPTYNVLYNNMAIVDARGIAPTGFHIATDDDWQDLIDYLLGLNVMGGKLKSKQHWGSINEGATNETGFTAVPSGMRSEIGLIQNTTTKSYHWIRNNN